MFDTGFAQIFRAVDRIRTQLETADGSFKAVLAEELACLRRLGDQYMDHWMALDEQIGELLDTHGLHVSTDTDSTDISESPPKLQGVLSRSRTALNHEQQAAGLSSRTQHASFEWDEHIQDAASAEFAEPMFDNRDPITVNFRKGMGYFDLFMFDDAIDLLSDVVRQSGHEIAELYLAAALLAKERYHEALGHLKVVREGATNYLVICAANEIEAQIHVAQGNIHEATRCFLDISLKMPDYQDVWFNLGVCHAIRKDYMGAEQAFAQALSDKPKDAEAAYLLASVQFFGRRLHAAEETCLRALQLFPKDVRFERLLIHALSAEGRHDKALRRCRRLYRLVPEDSAIASQLAWMYVRHGQLNEAVGILKKQTAMIRDSSSLLAQLGIVLMLSGDLERAELVLFEAMDIKDAPGYVWLALGQISTKKGDLEGAYQRYLRALRDPRRKMKRLALYYLGCTLFLEEKFVDSEKYLKAAAVLGGSNPAIWLMLGRVAEKLGRDYEAVKLYRRAGINTASQKANS